MQMTTLTLPNEVLVIDRETETVKPQLQKPSLYNVIMVDDDKTSMQFVCDILEGHFNKTTDQAYEHMMDVHLTGGANVGTFTKDVAETKISLIHELANQREFPFQLKLVELI